jgi:uncharacterized membrane protein (UPF0127 family)
MQKIIRVFKGGRSCSVSVLPVHVFTQFTGLMFKTRRTPIRLFSYSSSRRVAIHSWFVFFPFLVVWLDGRNQIIEFRVVQPFTSYVLPSRNAVSFLEIPLDGKNQGLVSFIVGKGKHLNRK